MYVCDMPGRTFHRMSQMPDINILSLCYGSQDILWVGSDGQGVFQVYNDGIQFDKIPNSRIFGDRNCPVRAFCEDSRGNVYVATKGNGIGMLRPDGSRGAVYDVSGGLGNNSVYALAGDSATTCSSGTTAPGSMCFRVPRGASRPSNLSRAPISVRCMRFTAIRRTAACGSGRTATG